VALFPCDEWLGVYRDRIDASGAVTPAASTA